MNEKESLTNAGLPNRLNSPIEQKKWSRVSSRYGTVDARMWTCEQAYLFPNGATLTNIFKPKYFPIRK